MTTIEARTDLWTLCHSSCAGSTGLLEGSPTKTRDSRDILKHQHRWDTPGCWAGCMTGLDRHSHRSQRPPWHRDVGCARADEHAGGGVAGSRGQRALQLPETRHGGSCWRPARPMQLLRTHWGFLIFIRKDPDKWRPNPSRGRTLLREWRQGHLQKSSHLARHLQIAGDTRWTTKVQAEAPQTPNEQEQPSTLWCNNAFLLCSRS